MVNTRAIFCYSGANTEYGFNEILCFDKKKYNYFILLYYKKKKRSELFKNG